MAKRGGDRSAKARAAGKQIGRPKKPKVQGAATKSVAAAVLGTIDEEKYWRVLLRCDTPVEKMQELSLAERQQIKTVMEYLTNRRDGKPAESVIAEGKLVIEVIEKTGRADSPATETEALSKIM